MCTSELLCNRAGFFCFFFSCSTLSASVTRDFSRASGSRYPTAFCRDFIHRKCALLFHAWRACEENINAVTRGSAVALHIQGGCTSAHTRSIFARQVISDAEWLSMTAWWIKGSQHKGEIISWRGRRQLVEHFKYKWHRCPKWLYGILRIINQTGLQGHDKARPAGYMLLFQPTFLRPSDPDLCCFPLAYVKGEKQR